MVTLSDAREEASEHLGQFVEGARRQGFVLVQRKLEEAIAAGEIIAGTDTAAISRYILSVQQGMSILARDGATAAELREVADAAMRGWSALAPGA
jgi:hypothetical protein